MEQDLARVIRARRKDIAAAIVLAGLIAALAIYLTAAPPSENPLGYNPEDSKEYLRQLEMYGGKANVLAVELRQWFDSLWQGKTLALTVAVLSVLLALGLLVVVPPAPDGADPAATSRHDPRS